MDIHRKGTSHQVKNNAILISIDHPSTHIINYIEDKKMSVEINNRQAHKGNVQTIQLYNGIMTI